jgi:hypothetical protein
MDEIWDGWAWNVIRVAFLVECGVHFWMLRSDMEGSVNVNGNLGVLVFDRKGG